MRSFFMEAPSGEGGVVSPDDPATAPVLSRDLPNLTPARRRVNGFLKIS
jgi:hypothetical protein